MKDRFLHARRAMVQRPPLAASSVIMNRQGPNTLLDQTIGHAGVGIKAKRAI